MTLRDKIDYIGPVAVVARMLDIERTTLYNYISGVSPTPAEVAAKVDEIYNGLIAFDKGLPGFIADLLAKDFPQGIRSEIDGE